MAFRTLATLILAGGLAAPAMAQQLRQVQDERWCDEEGGGDGAARTCSVYEASWAGGSPVSVDARPNGGISVTGWDRNEVRLRAKLTTRANDEATARQIASEVQIHAGAEVRADGPSTSGRNQSWSVSYQLQVPSGATLSLQSTNGGIHLENVNGNLNFSTTNGGLHLSHVGGKVVGHTTNGGLHVELTGTEWQGDGLDLSTTNGGIHLEVPRGYNAHLNLGTTNGRVDSDLPGVGSRGKRGDDDEGDESGTWSGHSRRRTSIDADLGSGGKLLRLRTTNGGVHIASD